MHVDETRCDVQPVGVDDAASTRAVELADGGDATVLDSDVVREPRIARPVENAAATDQNVVGG